MSELSKSDKDTLIVCVILEDDDSMESQFIYDWINSISFRSGWVPSDIIYYGYGAKLEEARLFAEMNFGCRMKIRLTRKPSAGSIFTPRLGFDPPESSSAIIFGDSQIGTKLLKVFVLKKIPVVFITPKCQVR